jgi:hypothetical protein
MILTNEMKKNLRIPYALRRVSEASFACLLPHSASPQPGDIVLARLEKIGKNAHLELTDGRRCALHEHDLLAAVFGNRYAPHQFEGYARSNGDRCDLLSIGGLCGLVKSKHDKVAEPTRLRLLGALADANGQPLRLQDFALAPTLEAPCSDEQKEPKIITVCGTSMDAGKTYTAMSLIVGLRRKSYRVAAIKLTGTATGADRWSMLDAGACVALDFIDGGWPATYLCTVDELMNLYHLLIAHASAQGVDYVVIEISDGLLQSETEALLQTPRFTASVHAWMLAASDPLGAVGAVSMLRKWQIEPLAVSGVISMSPLGIREIQAATGLQCLTAKQLQSGEAVAQQLRNHVHSPNEVELAKV